MLQQARVWSQIKFTLRLAIAVILCGAIALYAVGASWYWDFSHHLPAAVTSAIAGYVARVRSLLADDTTIAEEQAAFYVSWILAVVIALLAWAVLAATRRALGGRRGSAA